MRVLLVGAMAMTASSSSAQRMNTEFVKKMMSIPDVKERNAKVDDNDGRRTLLADKKMMARVTDEQKQSLQSRLLKHARGLINAVDEHDHNVRSLKGDDSDTNVFKKEDKPGAKPTPVKAPSKEADSNRPGGTVENKLPVPKLVHPLPANASSKENDAGQKDKDGGNSKAENKLPEPKLVHPPPANGPSKENDDTNQKDKADEDPGRSGAAENKASEAEHGSSKVAEDTNPKEKVDEITIPGIPSGSKGSDSSKSSTTNSGTSSSSSHSSSSSTGKSSKSSKGGTCDKRLTDAYNQIRALPDDFGVVTSPSEITAACAFDPTNAFNYGCPFVYTTYWGFIDSEELYQAGFDNDAVGSAYWSFVLYCQCHQAFDLGCAAKIPHGPPSAFIDYEIGTKVVNSYSEFIPASTPEKRLDYCQMAGVWNGDFDTSVSRDFSPEVRDCGCFFVGTAKDMVGTCPGVDLGAFEAKVGAKGENTIDTELLMMENNATYYPTMSPSDEEE